MQGLSFKYRHMGTQINYKKISQQSRIKCLELVFQAQASHIGSLMSCADIMAVLFGNINLDQDKFILSAGWKACMLYYHLYKKDRITEDELNSYCQPGSKFIGLAEPIIPEIPAAGGSMGFGLPFGVGFSFAKKIAKENGRIFVLMGDGEVAIGTTWESALIAAQQKLDNLTVIIDANGFQAMGKVKDVLNIEPLKEKWQAFGWDVSEIDGHNCDDIEKVLLENSAPGKPKMIIARTIKGKGVSFMENNNMYHYKALSDQEYQEALKELNG